MYVNMQVIQAYIGTGNMHGCYLLCKITLYFADNKLITGTVLYQLFCRS